MKKILCLCLCFIMAISLASPAFASQATDLGLPDPYTVWNSDFQGRFPYAVVAYDGQSEKYYLYASASEITYVGGAYTAPDVEDDLTFLRWTYKSSDGVWSEYIGSTGSLYMATGPTHYEVISSSFDLLSNSGSVKVAADNDFFPAPPSPLWEEITQVTQGEMPKMAAETAKTASTLVACGIGCLALLMGLVLLAKKFKIFLR